MNNKWIAAWGCPIAKPYRNIAQWVKDTTVRFNIFMTVDGSALRFHFSNLFGEHQAEITHASVAAYMGDRAIDTARMATITFDGEQIGKMAAGEDICSDEIPFNFKAGETLSVSLYFGEFTQMTTAHQNGGRFMEKWVVSGDYTHTSQLDINDNSDADSYPFIHTIDALCSDDCYSIIAFGDSITAQSWPDRLRRRINEMGKNNVAVVRKAISGSRVLREYPCTAYQTYGPKGDARFEREVLRAGVKKVLILHGINDLIHPERNGSIFRPISHMPNAQQLIEGLMYYINTAHANGIEVYLSPILPFEGWRTYNEEKEAIRVEVNEWIYNEAPVEGVLPYETALQDPENPKRFLPQFDAGDHLHPSDAGAQQIADSTPKEWL